MLIDPDLDELEILFPDLIPEYRTGVAENQEKPPSKITD